jgi:hypothetical protein
MKTKILITITILASILLGCKNDKAIDSLEVVTTEVVENNLEVTLEVIVKKDDDFSLFFTEDGTSNFTEAPIWTGVKGNENAQKVVFNLPENTLPTNIRIDFGMKKDQSPIQILNYKMTFAGKTFEAPGTLFFKYFAPNLECTIVDKEKGLIIPMLKEGKYFGPSFYPEIALSEELDKLTK